VGLDIEESLGWPCGAFAGLSGGHDRWEVDGSRYYLMALARLISVNWGPYPAPASARCRPMSLGAGAPGPSRVGPSQVFVILEVDLPGAGYFQLRRSFLLPKMPRYACMSPAQLFLRVRFLPTKMRF
jgi:hypothetical protein